MVTISSGMVKELREKTGAAMMACKKALEETQGDLEAAITLLRKTNAAKAEKRADKTAAQGKVLVASAADHRSAFAIEINSETDFVARDESFAAFAELVVQQGLAHKNTDVATTLANQHNGESLESLRTTLVGQLGENIRLRRVARLESAHYVGYYCHGDRIAVLIALDRHAPDLAKDIAMHIAAANPKALYETDVPAELIASERDIFIAQAEQSGKSKEIAEKMVSGRITKFLQEISLVHQPFVKDPTITIGALLKQHGVTIEAFVRFEVGEGIPKETHNFADEVMAQINQNN